MASHPTDRMHTPAPEEIEDGHAAVAGNHRGLRGVLWDMDGTIVDTEPYWIRAETELVEAHGGTWTDEQNGGATSYREIAQWVNRGAGDRSPGR